MDVRYVGIDFRTLTKGMGVQVANSVGAAAAWTLKRSKELVPLDKGDLRASGRKRNVSGTAMGKSYGTGAALQYTKKEAGVMKAPVVYGGSSMGGVGGTGRFVLYASAQHQKNYTHKNGRQRFYLLKALKECRAKNILGMNVKRRWAAMAALKGA